MDQVVKRVTDIIGSLVLCVLTSPILAVAAVAIRLDSPGPVLFRQERIGLNGHPFTVYKLRTMRVGAGSEWLAPQADEFADFVFQSPEDDRITATGRFLRRTSIDELPQLVNVLRGEMSLVGPRPEIPEMVALYTVEMHRRHDVLPGITGLAQVSGRGVLTTGEIMAYDLEYRDHWTLRLDLEILCRTVKQIVSGSQEAR